MNMEAAQWICKHCGDVFTTKGKYQSHYRREHQQQIKNNRSKEITGISRSEDGLFVCECGKRYQVLQSLSRHKQTCEGQEAEMTTAVESATQEMQDLRLEELPLKLEMKYKIIICTICCIGFPLEWVCSHLKGKHGISTTIEDVQEMVQVAEEQEGLSASQAKKWLLETWILNEPVKGIPVVGGWECQMCTYSCVHLKVMKNHFSKKHSGESWQQDTAQCKVQSVFQGRLQKCMIVEDDTDVEEMREDKSEWRTALEDEFKQAVSGMGERRDREVEDLRLLNGFLAKVRWDLKIRDGDWSKLMEMAKVPGKGDEMQRVVEGGKRYIKECCRYLSRGNMMVKKLLMTGR